MLILILTIGSVTICTATKTSVAPDEAESEITGKVLGSSVVTSVSVVMDGVNGSQTVFTDAAGKPVQKPAMGSQLASPIDLLNPDRYEFYTFNDSGHLVKRLMTIDEIQGIIASGDGEAVNYNTQQLENVPQKDVNDILSNVQNVLMKEIESHQSTSSIKPVYDTPDVSSSWSMILPAIFGNSGDEIQLQKPQGVVTPDTITFDSTTVIPTTDLAAEIKGVSDENVSSSEEFVAQTAASHESSLPPMTLSSQSKITEILPIETKTDTFNGDVTNNTEKENDEVPLIQVVITEKEPEKKLSSSTSELFTIPTTEKASTAAKQEIQYDVLNLDDSIFENSQHLSTTEIPIKTKSTERILLILSTIKKSPIMSSPAPFTTTLLPSTIDDANKKDETESIETVNKSDAINISDNVKNSSEELEANLDSTENQETSASTSIYEPEELDKVTVRQDGEFNTIPVTSLPISEKETIAYEEVSLLSVNPEENVTSQKSPITHNSDQSFINSDVLSTTTSTDLLSTVNTLNFIKDNETKSNFVESVQSNTPQDSSLNEGNIIQAMDDLISQIMGVNQTTIEYSSTLPSILNTAEEKINDQDISRTESEVLNLINPSGTDEVKTSTQTENIQDETTVYNESISSVTVTTPVNNKINDDDLSTLSSGDIFNFKLSTEKDFFESTTNPQNVSETGTLNNEEDKDAESMETSEDNNSRKNITFLLTAQANQDSFEQKFTRNPTAHENFSETTENIISTFSTTLSNEDHVTTVINYDKISSFNDDKGSNIHSIEYSQEEQNGKTTEQENTKNISIEEGDDNIENSSIKASITEGAQSTSNLIQEVASPISINELVTNTPLNNIELPSTTEGEIAINVTESHEKLDYKNNSNLYVRITAAPINRDRNTVSPSTITLDYKSPTQSNVFLNVHTVTTASSRKPIEVKPVTLSADATSSLETTWKLLSTISPPKETTTEIRKSSTTSSTLKPPNSIDLIPDSTQGYGLEETTAYLDSDVYRFTELCNELSFSIWSRMIKYTDILRSIFISPFATTSMLAMVFLGARGGTSGEMNDILKLDDMVTFNPHSVFKNVTDTIEISKDSGVAASVILRELYSDKTKGKLLSFYKERVRHFYDGHVEEVNFTSISDVIRRRTNLLVKRNTWGKIHEYIKDNSISARPPLAAITASIFQTDCSNSSTSGRDGELHFVFSPTTRQRKLVPIPAAVWSNGFLAGYDPGLDATAVSLGTTEHTISTLFVIPGQQGIAAPGDGLSSLEERLTKTAFAQGSWSRLLRSLIPRPGLEVQIPRFAHRSIINTTNALEEMGLKDLFSPSKADLKGLNGYAHEMFLSDLVQVNYFVMCGEDKVSERHYYEEYPVNLEHSYKNSRGLKFYQDINQFSDPWSDPKEQQRAFDDSLFDTSLLDVPLPLRPRQARVPDMPRLRFDRPFLYFVRHNPTGLILHMGRFNPRLYQ